ncbi:MAG: cytochrome c biogenesis protein CcsA [Microscillaceae bacterium]
MINTWIGNLGHTLVITAFVFALLNTYSYFRAVFYQGQEDAKAQSWRRFARLTFGVYGLAVLGVIAALFDIIYHHRYEYHYAWDHSSNHLPVYYMISCFWEGQEGSFLLWIFWHVCLGGILILTNRHWEASVMTVVSAVQAFLLSMILGVVVLGVKIGSDPFILLRDAMPHLPVFQPGSPAYNPNFVPEDGSGLNALLQNYWMVIHPPTLFLGFALTLIPFAYVLAGLWQKNFKEWVRPALPWALVAGAVLGLGILMGGYWAYETLNFGGYWNWDPVENAVYVPWLVLVAAIHTMIAFKKNSTALKAAMILSVTTFLLILYSTFLTRSGILGNASVHSFTDLGLSGQLLLYLLFFVFASVGLMVYRWRQIPVAAQEVSTYSREFWIFIGATVLCLAGFQVIMTTSIPVFNAIAEGLGFVSNLALPVDQIAHYTRFQLWAGVLIALLSGTGQFFWWKKMDQESFLKAITLPVILTLLISSGLIALSGMSNWQFIVLLTASVYSIVANLTILVSLLRKKTYKLAGGSIAHIGIAMMLLGILASAGYSRVVSKNVSGLLLFNPKANPDIPTNENEDNLLLWLQKPSRMLDYQVTYKGDYIEARRFPGYISKNDLAPTADPFQAIAQRDIRYQGKKYFSRGDTLDILPENTYYRVEYRDEKGRVFSLYPRAQVNPQMGGLLASPDIYRRWNKDIYTHVSSVPDPTEPRQWSEAQEHEVALRDTFFLNDYVAIFEARETINAEEVMRLTANESPAPRNANDVGVQATVRILSQEGSYEARPVFFIRDGQVGTVPDLIPALGLRIGLNRINPETGQFTFAVNTTQKDYIIMKALEKPFINVLWMGTLVVMLGFGIAIYRRYTEFRTMRDRGLEVRE